MDQASENDIDRIMETATVQRVDADELGAEINRVLVDCWADQEVMQFFGQAFIRLTTRDAVTTHELELLRDEALWNARNVVVQCLGRLRDQGKELAPYVLV